MKTNSKIAVIGGTGKAGRYLVNTLLRQGHPLKLLVRNPENLTFTDNSLEVIYGDVRNEDQVNDLVKDCSAVLSTLGGSPLSEPSVFSQSTKNVLRALSKHQIRRYIVVAGLNVDTPHDQKGPKTRAGTQWMWEHFPESTQDRQLEYELLCQSSADWTLIRLPLIQLTDHRKAVAYDLTDCLGDGIGAADLAFFMTEQILKPDLVGKAPFLFNKD